MEQLTIDKEYIKDTNGNILVEKFVQEMLDNASADFKIVVASGCAMQFTHDEKNQKIIIKTKYPVSILKAPDGTPISVMQMAK